MKVSPPWPAPWSTSIWVGHLSAGPCACRWSVHWHSCWSMLRAVVVAASLVAGPLASMLGVLAEPRPSASVILVRDAPRGLETFMVRRHARSPVAPSAYVFPGGTVRDDDLEVAAEQGTELARMLSERSDTPVEGREAAALYVCAMREL